MQGRSMRKRYAPVTSVVTFRLQLDRARCTVDSSGAARRGLERSLACNWCRASRRPYFLLGLDSSSLESRWFAVNQTGPLAWKMPSTNDDVVGAHQGEFW